MTEVKEPKKIMNDSTMNRLLDEVYKTCDEYWYAYVGLTPSQNKFIVKGFNVKAKYRPPGEFFFVFSKEFKNKNPRMSKKWLKEFFEFMVDSKIVEFNRED